MVGLEVWNGAGRTERQVQPQGRPDSKDEVWLVAPAGEQLTAVTGDGSHGIAFR